MTTPDSYPFMHLARRLGVPYGMVLRLADDLEKRCNPSWANRELCIQVAHALAVERERRNAVVAGAAS